MWSRNYESEGFYSNDKEIRNMYVRNNGRYSTGKNTNTSSGSESGGCLYYYNIRHNHSCNFRTNILN